MKDFLNEASSNKGIRIAGVAVLSLLAVFLLALIIDTVKGFDDNSIYPAKTITVSGKGEATVIPDVARVTFTVQETAADVGTAQAAATKRTDDALNALGAQGVEESDLKTLSYNVYPQYEQVICPNGMCTASPKISGYQVSQTVQVKVRDTAKVGEVLQALGDLGVQNINGPEFTLDDEDAGKADARAAAIEDARSKAKLLAKELGVHLGKVVSFYEETGAYPMMYEGYAGKGAAMDMAAQAAPSLPVGESETSVTVNITYEIR